MANAKHFCMCFMDAPRSAQDVEDSSKPRAAVLNGAKWQRNETIRCHFLGGSPKLQERVAAVAKEWENHANLKFAFAPDDKAAIRISFIKGDGSWSYLGTQCRNIQPPEPTMNYGWIDEDSDDVTLRSVVLHEFGHALGLIHEHQNPSKAIQWNRQAVKNDLGGPPNNWDDATIENNMFKYYPKSDVTTTPVDPKSIMMYPIPESWTLDDFSAGFNAELSDNDKRLIRMAYPR